MCIFICELISQETFIRSSGFIAFYVNLAAAGMTATMAPCWNLLNASCSACGTWISQISNIPLHSHASSIRWKCQLLKCCKVLDGSEWWRGWLGVLGVGRWMQSHRIDSLWPGWHHMNDRRPCWNAQIAFSFFSKCLWQHSIQVCFANIRVCSNERSVNNFSWDVIFKGVAWDRNRFQWNRLEAMCAWRDEFLETIDQLSVYFTKVISSSWRFWMVHKTLAPMRWAIEVEHFQPERKRSDINYNQRSQT